MATVLQPLALEPTTQQFVDSLAAAGGPPVYTLSPSAAREVLTSLQAAPVEKAPASIEDTDFPVGPTGTVRIRIVRPKDTAARLPVVMHIHGGGWILGDKNTHDRFTREIAVGRTRQSSSSTTIARRKHATPSQSSRPTRRRNTSWSTARSSEWIPVVWRSSAIAWAATWSRRSRFSRRSEAAPRSTSRCCTIRFWDAYLPEVQGREAITASPLRASIEQLRRLPEALVMVDENDVLRDEGEAYARKLSQAGVRVTTVRYNGTIHDFMLLNPIAQTPAVRAAIRQANDALQGVLHA